MHLKNKLLILAASLLLFGQLFALKPIPMAAPVPTAAPIPTAAPVPTATPIPTSSPTPTPATTTTTVTSQGAPSQAIQAAQAAINSAQTTVTQLEQQAQSGLFYNQTLQTDVSNISTLANTLEADLSTNVAATITTNTTKLNNLIAQFLTDFKTAQTTQGPSPQALQEAQTAQAAITNAQTVVSQLTQQAQTGSFYNQTLQTDVSNINNAITTVQNSLNTSSSASLPNNTTALNTALTKLQNDFKTTLASQSPATQAADAAQTAVTNAQTIMNQLMQEAQAGSSYNQTLQTDVFNINAAISTMQTALSATPPPTNLSSSITNLNTLLTKLQNDFKTATPSGIIPTTPVPTAAPIPSSGISPTPVAMQAPIPMQAPPVATQSMIPSPIPSPGISPTPVAMQAPIPMQAPPVATQSIIPTPIPSPGISPTPIAMQTPGGFQAPLPVQTPTPIAAPGGFAAPLPPSASIAAQPPHVQQQSPLQTSRPAPFQPTQLTPAIAPPRTSPRQAQVAVSTRPMAPTTPTTIPTTTGQEPEPVRYGDIITLKSKQNGYYLTGRSNALPKQPMLVTTNTQSDGDLWIIKGPHAINSKFNCTIGSVVKRGDSIRLEQVASGKNINCTVLLSPTKTVMDKAPVALNGISGVGDSSDTWHIKTDPTEQDQTLFVNDSIKIAFQGSGASMMLYPWPAPSPDGSCAVIGINVDNDACWWVVDSSQALINAPAGFEKEAGTTTGITCGSRTTGGTAQLEVWCLSQDRSKLLHYLPTSTNANPWESITPTNEKMAPLGLISDLSVASDGTFVILLDNGIAYSYDWVKKYFTALLPVKDPKLTFDVVTAGNSTSIFSVNKTTKTLYQYNGKDWVVVQQSNTNNVDAALDGTVVTLDSRGSPQLYLGGGQFQPLGNTSLENVAVGSMSKIIGVTENGGLLRYDPTQKSWSSFLDADGDPVTGIGDVTMNAAGTIFLCTHISNEIYNNSDDAYLIKSISDASAAEKGINKNMKKVAGSVQKSAKNTSRFEGRKAGRIAITAQTTLPLAQKQATPVGRKKRFRKIRKIRRVGIPTISAQKQAVTATKQAQKPARR